MSDFGNKVNRFGAIAQARLRAASRMAVQDTVEDAQHPMKAGGRMRIDTGFLRASIQGAINGTPKGPTDNPNRREYSDGEQAAGEPIAATLLRWDILRGQFITVGWTANYARYREYKDGFLRGAVADWKKNVTQAAIQMKARIK